MAIYRIAQILVHTLGHSTPSSPGGLEANQLLKHLFITDKLSSNLAGTSPMEIRTTHQFVQLSFLFPLHLLHHRNKNVLFGTAKVASLKQTFHVHTAVKVEAFDISINLYKTQIRFRASMWKALERRPSTYSLSKQQGGE